MPDFSSISNEWTQTGLLSAQTVLASGETVVRKTAWEYATSGVPVSKTVFGPGLPQAGVKESYGYDSARRMTSLIDANGRRQADILVRDGRIAAIGPDIVYASGAEVTDCCGKLYIPHSKPFSEHGNTQKQKEKECGAK